MEQGGFFFQALVYLTAAVVAVPVAKKLGLGSVLGYLLAGIIIGPFLFGFIGEEGQDVMHFAEFGVVMMLFLVGLELQPSMIWKLRKSIFGLGGFQTGITAAIIMGIAIIMGFAWQTGLAIGLTFALSSTAIVIQSLNEKGLMKTEAGQNAFSVLLFQDIAVIPILAILPYLAIKGLVTETTDVAHHSSTWVDGWPIWGTTLLTLGVISTIIFAGKYLISQAFRFIAKTDLRELFTIAALLLVISTAALMTMIGLSPALGTFVAGVVLAQSEYRHELETDIEPFKGLLLGLFFIAVGASIDFHLIAESPKLIFGLVAILIAVKFVVLFVIGYFFKMGLDKNMIFSFSLAQGGEFAFVLLSFSTSNSIISSDVANPLIAVVAISMALTPLLMLFNEKLIQPRFGTKESVKEADEMQEDKKVIIAGFGRYGSTIGRFLQANGVYATYLDIDPDNVDLLRKFDLKVFYGDASRNDLLKAAGAAEADLLIVAVDDPNKTKEIVATVKKNYPKLKLVVRSQSFLSSYSLIEQGVDRIQLDFLDSALRMGTDALCYLGHRRHESFRASKTYRKNVEKFIPELSEVWQDKSLLISEAKKRMQFLEKSMLQEKEDFHKEKDMGWDASDIIKEFGEGKI
ncbi:monovalent cation:proton antiporter-2 (CPA2) family protein [Ancylomarina sp. 16SWW S1-10-2]|uniref:monovalent cation:proton antiporter-2 (CPA2) family protein n=1 Tax=Ancylomarina sp. 16SWW S1-10-2 TaxID=2499681 RepID=UPI0012AEA1EE|nr:monovalent cation:proton antiporter-2 (CPA2) family protein [Ancylomarina sp. 16SWW S1-10-2]MRT92907.1 potassium transporter [Ancylomarina sp. 16SWW S1-10-2]